VPLTSWLVPNAISLVQEEGLELQEHVQFIEGFSRDFFCLFTSFLHPETKLRCEGLTLFFTFIHSGTLAVIVRLTSLDLIFSTPLSISLFRDPGKCVQNELPSATQ
jgi:hypothetical protein